MKHEEWKRRYDAWEARRKRWISGVVATWAICLILLLVCDRYFQALLRVVSTFLLGTALTLVYWLRDRHYFRESDGSEISSYVAVFCWTCVAAVISFWVPVSELLTRWMHLEGD
jgi:hypothetical protein